MKKILLIAALLAGCTTVQKPEAPVAPGAATPMPPAPPGVPPLPVLAPKARAKAVAGPLLASRQSALAKAAPAWAFTNISGTYQIDASTDLVTWWPVAVVYDAVSLSLTSDTVGTQPVLFYRLQPVTN